MDEVCQELQDLRSDFAYGGAASVAKANHQRVVEELEGQVRTSRGQLVEKGWELEAVRKELEAARARLRQQEREAQFAAQSHQRITAGLEGQLAQLRDEVETLHVHGAQTAEDARRREMAEVDLRVQAEMDRDFLLGVLQRNGINVTDLKRT